MMGVTEYKGPIGYDGSRRVEQRSHWLSITEEVAQLSTNALNSHTDNRNIMEEANRIKQITVTS